MDIVRFTHLLFLFFDNSIKENENFIENLKVEVIRSENLIKTEADRRVQIYKNKLIQLLKNFSSSFLN